MGGPKEMIWKDRWKKVVFCQSPTKSRLFHKLVILKFICIVEYFPGKDFVSKIIWETAIFKILLEEFTTESSSSKYFYLKKKKVLDKTSSLETLKKKKKHPFLIKKWFHLTMPKPSFCIINYTVQKPNFKWKK